MNKHKEFAHVLLEAYMLGGQEVLALKKALAPPLCNWCQDFHWAEDCPTEQMFETMAETSMLSRDSIRSAFWALRQTANPNYMEIDATLRDIAKSLPPPNLRHRFAIFWLKLYHRIRYWNER